MKIFLYLISLVCAVLLVWGGPEEYASIFGKFWNFGHVVFFAALTLLVLKESKRAADWSLSKQALIFSVGVFIFSLVIELAQMTMKFRTPDILDIGRNLVGSLFALVFFSPSRNRVRTVRLRLFQCAVLIGLVICLAPLAVAIADKSLTRLRAE